MQRFSEEQRFVSKSGVFYLRFQQRHMGMLKPIATMICLLAAISSGRNQAFAHEFAPVESESVTRVRNEFRQLVDNINGHRVAQIRAMFWNSPSALIVAKNVRPGEESWAGFWGIDAVMQKIHDIASSGSVQLIPDYQLVKAVEISPDVTETYAPMKISVSYGGQDPTPRPFIMIVEWLKVSAQWKIASEIILPIPRQPASKT